MLKPDPGLGRGIHLVGIIWNEEIWAITAVLAILEVLRDDELPFVLVWDSTGVQRQSNAGFSQRLYRSVPGRNEQKRSGVWGSRMPTIHLAARVQAQREALGSR